MPRLGILAVSVYVVAASVTAPSADRVADALSTPVTRFDFGLMNLNNAATKWAASYREQPGVRVIITRNRQSGIDFYIDPSDPLRSAKTRIQAEAICNQIAQHFMSMMLGNTGDPNEKDINGNSIYFVAWGSYFSLSGDTREAIEDIGRVVSAGSVVSIYVGRPDLERCEFRTGEKYKLVPYA